MAAIYKLTWESHKFPKNKSAIQQITKNEIRQIIAITKRVEDGKHDNTGNTLPREFWLDPQ